MLAARELARRPVARGVVLLAVEPAPRFIKLSVAGASELILASSASGMASGARQKPFSYCSARATVRRPAARLAGGGVSRLFRRWSRHRHPPARGAAHGSASICSSRLLAGPLLFFYGLSSGQLAWANQPNRRRAAARRGDLSSPRRANTAQYAAQWPGRRYLGRRLRRAGTGSLRSRTNPR